jgi:hypothetical protein
VTDTPVTDTPVTDTPVTDTPVTDTPVTDTPVPVEVAEPAVEGSEQTPHTLMRRIRVTHQIKVNGEVIEETSAEELIDADADPEPVRQRLREQLHRQASARMEGIGDPQDPSNPLLS